MRVSNHIKSAVGSLSQHKGLSHDILTTSDFGQICPVMAVPLLPRDKMQIRASCFARVAPMIFPTYGHCQLITNFHSVQYNQLWKDFDLFVTGQKYNGSSPLYFPVVSINTIASSFLGASYTYAGDADVSNHDIEVVTTTGQSNYRFLTPFGRYVRKVLNLLGYPYLTRLDFSSSATEVVMSALPLLAFFKVYHDFYESRQYASTSVIKDFLSGAFTSTGNTYWTRGASSDAIDGINRLNLSSISIFDRLLLLFPSDYVTSAQTYPSLVGGNQNIVIPSDTASSLGRPIYQLNALTQNNDNVSYSSGVVSSQVSQSNPMHRLLDNFENMIRRFNLVGSREIDRIRAQFGIVPKVAKNQYSRFYGGFSSELHIQDVTSTSAEPSVDNYLGSYAGKGIISDGDSFNIDSDDFGMMLAFSFIKVTPLYSPGLSREILKTSFFSYYNPDFDHGYAQAVSIGEVVSSLFGTNTYSRLTSTFGYQNAYDDYRQILSRVSGDFLDDDSLPWSFVRDNIGSTAQSDSVIYQSKPNSSTDGQPYNEFQRIFVDGSNRDHFYLYYNFDINALRPVRTSSESFDLGVGNVSTSNNPVI